MMRITCDHDKYIRYIIWYREFGCTGIVYFDIHRCYWKAFDRLVICDPRRFNFLCYIYLWVFLLNVLLELVQYVMLREFVYSYTSLIFAVLFLWFGWNIRWHSKCNIFQCFWMHNKENQIVNRIIMFK